MAVDAHSIYNGFVRTVGAGIFEKTADCCRSQNLIDCAGGAVGRLDRAGKARAGTDVTRLSSGVHEVAVFAGRAYAGREG